VTDLTAELLTELDQIRRLVGEPVEEPDIVGAVRRLVQGGSDDARRYRALHPYLRGCMGYDERGHVLVLGPRSIPTGVTESGWTGELIDAAADYAVAVRERNATKLAALITERP